MADREQDEGAMDVCDDVGDMVERDPENLREVGVGEDLGDMVERDVGNVDGVGIGDDVRDMVERDGENVGDVGVRDTVERGMDKVREVGVYKGVEDTVERGMAKVGEVGGYKGVGDMVKGGMAKVGEVGPTETDMRRVEIDIEKVREAASSHFKDLPKDQQEEARSFFRAMDKDKNGSINVQEFRTFLTRAEFGTDNCERVFKELDKDKSGALDFDELVTFFYVLSCEEYKAQLSRENTGGPDRKATPPSQATGNTKSTEWQAENCLPTDGANDGGQRSNRGGISRMFRKILAWVFEKAGSLL